MKKLILIVDFNICSFKMFKKKIMQVLRKKEAFYSNFSTVTACFQEKCPAKWITIIRAYHKIEIHSRRHFLRFEFQLKSNIFFTRDKKTIIPQMQDMSS